MSDEGDSKFWAKAKQNPMAPIGLTLLSGIVIHQLYNIRKKNKKLSLYLIELRLHAQGIAIACLTGGALFTIVKHKFLSDETQNEKKK